MSRWSHYDESDARVRPSRRGSRPRTKQRPAHEDAVQGVVAAVDRGRYTLEVSPAGEPARAVTAVTARSLGRKALVVGDRVDVVGDVSGAPDTLARVVRRRERVSALRRTADDTDPAERIIVANADQLAIIAAVADPPPNPRLIDRCLVAGFDGGLDTLLVLTKGDLASADAMRALYAPLGVPVVSTAVTAGDEASLADLRERLADRTTVLVGPSGVGKSTLVNALVPAADRAVGHVNAVTGRGRHTSTSSLMLDLPGGGWIIDTPGVRSFGLAHIEVDRVIAAFDDVAEVAAQQCPRGCTHAADADDCALDAWAESDPARASRLASLRRVLASRAADVQGG